MDSRETEVKFYIADLATLAARLVSLGTHVVEPRGLEVNLRFDTPAGDLKRDGRVIRLRKDTESHVAYKDGGQLIDGAIIRREIEFSVSDFGSARAFIEALGYDVVFIYEKYRTTYGFGTPETLIMLDELPYGNFVEIEGDLGRLRPVAQQLGLRWETAIGASYHTLFERLAGAV